MQLSNELSDLTRRDADVAIRPTVTPDETLVGEKLSDVEFYVYASAPAGSTGRALSWDNERWIGFDQSLQNTLPGKWMETHVSEDRIAMRSDSFMAIRVAAENGIGVAMLPHYLGDSSPSLQRIDAPVSGLKVGLWILTHPDLMRSARVHAFIEHFASALRP